jgi:hypothetical protein
MSRLIFWAEGLNENFMEGFPCCIAWGTIPCLVPDGVIGEGCSAVALHVGQDPMDLGLVIMELCSA